MKHLTDVQLHHLKNLGWMKMQGNHDGWKWFKFDFDGHIVAYEGDETWKKDSNPNETYREWFKKRRKK